MNRLVFLTLFLLGCGEPGPRLIAYGMSDCTHCHMTVADARYGAQLVTIRNKVLVFDDPGCLALYLASGEMENREVHSLWVNDFLEPDSLVEVTEAVFVRSDSLRTPMDTRLAALRPGSAADSLIRALGGERLTWSQVQASASEHVHASREPVVGSRQP